MYRSYIDCQRYLARPISATREAIESAGALQRFRDGLLMRREGRLQRRSAVRIGCIGIRTVREQHLDRARLTAQHRQHQRRATVLVARIGRPIGDLRLQLRNVTDFSGAS